MKFETDRNLKGIKVKTIDSDPLAWSKGQAGWVTLHKNELATLKILMQSLKEPNIQKIELPTYTNGQKRTYHQLYVKDLLMAYEIINMSRLTGVGQRRSPYLPPP